MIRRFLLAALLSSLCTGVYAQEEEAEAEESGPWSGNVALGYLSTSGNTETTSYNLAFEVSYDAERWRHTVNGAAAGASDNDVPTAENYQAGIKTEYKLTDPNYLFGLVDWRKDRFSGVDQDLSTSFGYGRRLIDKEKHQLSAEIGAGYKRSRLADGTTDTGAIGRLGLDYTWTFSENAYFEENIGVETGSDNTFIESVSAVHANVFGNFALVVSYTVRHNTDVPAGSVKTDKFSALSLEYAF